MPQPKKLCSFPGCDLKHRCKGYCEGHYSQLKRTGKVTHILSRSSHSTEFKDPENAAKFIELMNEPGASLAGASRACGFPLETGKALARRMNTKYMAVNDEVKALTAAYFVKETESKMEMALNSMTQEKFDASSLRDSTVCFGIMTDKRQLMMGEPTQIVSIKELADLRELLPELLNEVQRRGITIEGEILTE